MIEGNGMTQTWVIDYLVQPTESDDMPKKDRGKERDDKCVGFREISRLYVGKMPSKPII